MVQVRRVKLDVLKPRHPDVLEFASMLAEDGADYEVYITVIEMDESTETLEIVICGADIQFARIEETINSLGGSLHSIDEVTVASGTDDEQP